MIRIPFHIRFVAMIAMCLLISVGQIFGQNFDNYVPLKCAGPLPKAVYTSSADTYAKEVKQIESTTKKAKVKKQAKRFSLRNAYALDDLMRSGDILFGDTISQYLAKVVNQLTPDQKAGKRQIEVYTLRTPVVNAFATDRGILFVSLGMLARVESEAQLAFVLAHELSHVQEQHGLELFLKEQKLDVDGDRKSNIGSRSQKSAFSRNLYSKEHELEADAEGFKLFEKSNYSFASTARMFDLLKFANQPFADQPFDRAFFESSTFKLPRIAWLDSTQAVVGTAEDEDDDESTHPNLEKRRAQYNKLLGAVKDQTGSEYLVSESSFKLVQNMARFELSQTYLHELEISNAIYNSYLLLKDFPNNIYLEKTIAKALYFNAKFESDDDYTRYKSWRYTEGKVQAVHYLFDTLTSREATVLATRYVYQLAKKYPNDTELAQFRDDLFIELGQYADAITDFKLTEIKPETEEPPAVATALKKKKKKSKKADGDDDRNVKKKREKQLTYRERREKENAREMKEKEIKEKRQGMEHWRNGFEDFKQDTTFVSSFGEGQKKYKARVARTEKAQTTRGRKEYFANKKRKEEKGLMLGEKKIAILNPRYFYINSTKKDKVEYILAEEKQKNLVSVMQQMHKETKLDAVILDAANLKAGDVEKFNDIRYLNEWFSEQIIFDDLPVTYGSQQDHIKQLAKKYGTDQFLWTGVITEKYRDGKQFLTAFYSLFLPPLLLVTVPRAIQPDYKMVFYGMLYDVESCTYEIVKYDFVGEKDTNTQLKAQYYDLFNQIVTKKK
jgi:beta-barrel assembly-enhancing protease